MDVSRSNSKFWEGFSDPLNQNNRDNEAASRTIYVLKNP